MTKNIRIRKDFTDITLLLIVSISLVIVGIFSNNIDVDNQDLLISSGFVGLAFCGLGAWFRNNSNRKSYEEKS